MWCSSNNTSATHSTNHKRTTSVPPPLLPEVYGSGGVSGLRIGVAQLARLESVVGRDPAEPGLAGHDDAIGPVGHGALAGGDEIGGRAVRADDGVRAGTGESLCTRLLLHGLLESSDRLDHRRRLRTPFLHELGDPVGEV